MNRFRRQPPGTRWLPWAAVCALLLAGLLGTLHRSLHPGVVAPALQAATKGFSDAASLFALHNDGDAQCRLLDQALQADGTPAVAKWLPAVLPPAPPAVATTSLEGGQALFAYLARAPPGAA